MARPMHHTFPAAHAIRWWYLLLALGSALLWVNNGQISLWDQDEAAYAGFGYHMIESGDWLVPEFVWSDVHRKTPLHFWGIALAYLGFGVHEWSVRLPAVLSILGTYAWMWWGLRGILAERPRLLGAAVLSSTFLVSTLGKVAVTDGMLLCFSTGATVALLQLTRQPSGRWALIFWVNVALAMMTKGPPVLVLTGVLGGILLLWQQRDGRLLLRLQPWWGIPLAAAPLLLWGYLTAQQDGGAFVAWLIDWYILRRVGGSVFGQTGPPGTHLAIMALSFLPWLMYLPGAIRRAAVGWWHRDNVDGLLAAWWIAGWLIYEFSPSKLPAYAVAAHVPLALLVGRQLSEKEQKQWSPHWVWPALQALLLLVLLLGLPLASTFLDLSPSLTSRAWLASSLTILGYLGASLRWRSPHFPLYLGASNLACLLWLWLLLVPAIDGLRNAPRRVATYATSVAKPESKVLIGNGFGKPPSLPFYLKQSFTQVEVEQNLDSLWQAYQHPSPTILVLSQAQREAFSLRTDEPLSFHQISSRMTDRKGRAHYHVLLNPSARQ